MTCAIQFLNKVPSYNKSLEDLQSLNKKTRNC